MDRAALSTVARTNLPIALTSFVGREQELTEVRRQLDLSRLLTLTGTGGCGKTRLALQVAAEVVDAYPDGVRFVELAALADPDLTPHAVAATLNLREQPGQPILTTLLAALAGRNLLLVLDNCEHLLDSCAGLAEALLLGCPGLRIMATSREQLGVAGEVAWRVPSLPTPDPQHEQTVDGLAGYAVVRLFIERARLVQPAFQMTARNAPALAELCRRLDGMPLAIELAAARAASLTVEQITARLDDRFRLLTGGRRTALRRQQTLRAAIDWSHDLLTGAERALFRRLAVFADGWTMEAAEQVCAGGEVAPADVLDLLARLVDKSLVQADEQGEAARYRLLETVRQYAGERLLAAGEAAATRDRHGHHFLALAEGAEPGLYGHEQLAWLARLDAERDNLRAALEWLLARDTAAGLRLAGCLWHYWRIRSRATEGRRWLEGALAAAPAPSPPRGWALLGAGVLARVRGDLAAARARLDEALALGRAIGDRRLAAWTLRESGYLCIFLGDHEQARTRLLEALALVREVGDRRALGSTLILLGRVAEAEGNAGRARPLLEEGLTLARDAGDRYTTCSGLDVLGRVALRQGDHVLAQAALEEGLGIGRLLEAPWLIALFEEGLGRAARGRGDPAEAMRRLGASLARLRDLGDRRDIPICLEEMAIVLAGLGRAEPATRLLGAADEQRGALGTPRPPAERADHEAAARAARATLGEAAFAAAWAAGRALTPEAAVAEALAEAESDAVRRSWEHGVGAPARPTYPAGLTEREVEVLRLVTTGLTDAGVAERLSLSPRTVGQHLRSVYTKLGVSSRAAATRFAVEHRLA